MDTSTSDMPCTPSVLVDDSTAKVRHITLNRPHRLNALDGETLDLLMTAIGECQETARDIRVIVIRGNGRAFCSGNDLKWLASGVLQDSAAHLHNQDKMQHVFEALESAPQVVLASVHGHCVAGGFELALAADILLVAEDAQLGDTHLRRNFLPSGGGSQRLPRKLGQARSLFYLLTGRCMSGLEAERIGLAAVCTPADQLTTSTTALAQEIAATDSPALAAMKQLARRALELPLRDGLALERWSQFRYRTTSPLLQASVMAFAAQGTHINLEKL